VSLEELGLYRPPRKRRQQQQQQQQQGQQGAAAAATATAAGGDPAAGGEGGGADWGAPIRAAWDASEAAALARLDAFLSEGLPRYEKERGLADARAVSRLSPYLRFGQLSARLVWQRLKAAGCAGLAGWGSEAGGVSGGCRGGCGGRWLK
jgi:deoxyribodipyrimidine photolyase